ncbi:MAG: thiaminase II [Sulfolobaceae archaeon]
MTRLTEELWLSIKDIYNAILNHQFIKGLIDGSLEEEKFKYYIIQDYLYLKEFSKALALVASKAPKDEYRITFLEHGIQALIVERNLHSSFTKVWNINPEEYEMSPTNLAYTSYLLSVTSTRPFSEALAAVLPCYWIYMEVGKELLKKGSPNPLYRKWIETYGGEEYERGVRAVLTITDELKLDENSRREVFKHFRIASIYEYLFWDSAFRLEKFPFRVNTLV